MRPPPDTNVEAVVTRMLVAAEAHRLRGDTAAARGGFRSAETLLNLAARADPNDPTVRIGRGLTLASLARRSGAMREVEWLERYEAERQDRKDLGPPYWRARILARLGQGDAALDEIERLLVGPSLFSVHELRLSPDFDSLRNHPRYRALVERFSNPPSP